METTNNYENYPGWIVFFSNLVSLSIYCSGFVIMFHSGLIIALCYLAFVLFLEVRIISKHCVNCYYYGKTCGFGKGTISSLFFKKGDPPRFCSTSMSWKDMIPDLLVSLIPLVTAIILLIVKFNFIILISAIILISLTTMGNSFIRGSLTCKYCKQREIGCPAEKLFNKEK